MVHEALDLEYHPDWLNAVALGQYLDAVEQAFVFDSLSQNTSIHRVVDLSGGSGRIALPLAQRGYRMAVTDVSLVPLRRLKEKSREIETALVDPAARVLPFADASMDAALCIQVPFYVEDGRNWFFEEVFRIVRPGGQFVLTSTNRLSYKGILRRGLVSAGWMTPQSWHRFEYVSTVKELENRLEAVGFNVNAHQGYNWAPTLRFSNSNALPFYTKAERALQLNNLPAISPWVITKAHRPKQAM